MNLTRISGWLVICICLIIMCCSDSTETRLQRYLIQGNEKIREREYEQAERYFREALRLDSCFADALNNLGTVYHRRSNRGMAIEYYSQAIRCDASFLNAYINRANVFYESSNPAKALEDLDYIAQRKPDTLILHELSGLVYWKARRFEEAIASFRRASYLGADASSMLVNIGTLHAANRNPDSGRYYLKRAVELGDHEPNAFNALAMLEAEQGNNNEAMEWMERAIKLSPKDPYYMNNYGYLLMLRGRDDEALSLINESISLDPYNGWAYRNKGYYYLRAGNVEESIRLFKRAGQSGTVIDHLDHWTAEAYFAKGEKATACEYLKKAVALGDYRETDLAKRCR